MSGTAMLADHIEAYAEAILDHWRTTVAQDGEVPEARRLSHAELMDHIPILLERLADRLRGRPSDIAEAGQQHGLVRWSQGYEVNGVVAELAHLRTTLNRATFAYARENSLSLAAVETALLAIDEVLDESIGESVAQFQEETERQSEQVLGQIRERTQAAERASAVAASERVRLRAVLSHLPLGVWVIGPDGRIVGVNPEGERLQGFPAHEVVGRIDVLNHAMVYRMCRPDGSEYASDELPAARALRGETILQEEMTWLQPTRTLSVSTSAVPINGADGTILGAVSVSEDISARKRLEADLAGSEAQFRAIAEQSPMLIWRTGIDGRFNYVNPPWCAYRGRASAAEQGEGWLEGLHPEDRTRFRDLFSDAFGRQAPFQAEFRLLRHDGQYRWFADQGAPYHDSAGRFLGYLGSCLDITERIELEAALARQREMAVASSQHKTHLLAALSHDARTPLNAVVLAAQLLEVQVRDQADPEVQECLRTIRNSVKNVLDLLGDLLDLSKIDAGATPVEPTWFSLGPVMVECLSSVEGQARLKGLVVHLDLDGLDGLNVESDRAKIKQILGNLLSNAVRYTDRGSVKVRGERTADLLRIVVQDTGVGIALEDQARIFDEFARLGNRRPVATEGGTGLGLAICRRLANLLRGEIVLQSAPGQGSTFALVLPASIVREGLPDTKAPEGPSRATGSGSILVVEDDMTSRQFLAKVLRRLGYQALEASNGRDAIELIHRERPLAVLMDVKMPVMDGIDATLALRADPQTRDLPIFALTGDVSADNQQRMAEAGVDVFLEKPVALERLREALDRIEGRIQDGPPPA